MKKIFMIYKNRVIIEILSKEPLALVITSEEVANSFLQYFNLIWNMAEKVN